MAKRKKPEPKLHPAEQYVEDVLSGKIVAGKYVRLACARQKHDIQHAHKRGLYHDPEAAQDAIDFFSFLHHSKGKWAGKEIVLEPWQQFTLWCVFGWKWKDTGLRRYRVAYESVARKNGKSTKSAGTGLYGLIADKEQGAEIYTAATKRDQARIIHGEAVRMRNSSPSIKMIVGSVKDNLHVVETNSKFEPLGADQDTMDGLNVHFALIDELHAHKTRVVWDLLDTATGARDQSLIYAITTAGVDRSPRSICWEQHRYGMQLLEGFDQPDGIKDDTYFAYIASIDKDDDPFDERVWIKANPNLNVSVNMDDLRRKALRARESPAALNTFLRLHLNVWTDSVTVWVPATKWDECREEFTEEDLEGEDCYGGLDLADTKDIGALALIFPREEIREVQNPLSEEKELVEMAVTTYRTIFRFWIPIVNAESRSRRDQVMYKTWIEQGYLIDTEGDVIDHGIIERDILALRKKFRILQIGFDPWNSTGLVTRLQGEEVEIIPFRQGFGSMNAPTKELEKLILSKRIGHNGNPVSRWMLGNIAIKHDPAGNMKPDKEKSADKIDGIVALIIALGTAILAPPEDESPYTKRGLLTT